MLPWTLSAPWKVTGTSLFASHTFLLLSCSSQVDSMYTNPSNLLDIPRHLNPKESSPEWSTWYAMIPNIINSSSHGKFGGWTLDNYSMLNPSIVYVHRICKKQYMCACTYLKGNLYWITEESGWHPLS